MTDRDREFINIGPECFSDEDRKLRRDFEQVVAEKRVNR